MKDAPATSHPGQVQPWCSSAQTWLCQEQETPNPTDGRTQWWYLLPRPACSCGWVIYWAHLLSWRKRRKRTVLISLHLWEKQSLNIRGARIRPHTLQPARERWWQGGQAERRQVETGRAAIPTAQLSLKTLEVFTQERLLLPKHVLFPKREFNIVKWLLAEMWYQRAPHPPGLRTKCLPLSPLVGVE